MRIMAMKYITNKNINTIQENINLIQVITWQALH